MNKYQMLNYLSNYLDKFSPDKNLKTIINDYLLNPYDNIKYDDLKFQFIKLNINENLNFKTNIFYKITKENIIEVLFGNNNFYFNYEPNKINICKNKPAREFLLEAHIFLDIDDNSIISDNEGKNGRGGLHFLPSLSNNALISNICHFGESIVVGVNEPQLILAKENDTIKNKSNIIAFDEIYITQKYLANNPIVFKEFLLQLMSDHDNEFTINKFYNDKYNSFIANNGFDAIIEKLKIIEIFNTNKREISTLTRSDEIQDFIIEKLDTFIPEYYAETINFLNNAKEIYINLRKNKSFTPQLFCSALDEIYPGKLNIFDEKYQIEQFREAYGGKEFKERFLNNLAKTAESLSDKEIKKLFLHKKAFIIKTKQEEICDIILNYNKNNRTKQIPILLLINNFKQMNRNELEKLEQIINEYINGNTQYLYDYLIKQESLDLIVEKMNPDLDQIIENNRIQEEQTEIQNTIEETR